MFNQSSQIPHIISLLSTPYAYLALFILGFIEGPIVSIVAGFLVALGFMDFVPTYFILMFANLAGDTFYYSVGRFWFDFFYRKFFSFFKIKMGTVERVKNSILRNRGRTIIFGKLSHISSLVLVASGLAKIPFTDFIGLCFSVELPKALVLIFIGYYFGHSVASLSRAIDYTVFGFLAFTVVFIGVYILMEVYSERGIKSLRK